MGQIAIDLRFCRGRKLWLCDRLRLYRRSRDEHFQRWGMLHDLLQLRRGRVDGGLPSSFNVNQPLSLSHCGHPLRHHCQRSGVFKRRWRFRHRRWRTGVELFAANELIVKGIESSGNSKSARVIKPPIERWRMQCQGCHGVAEYALSMPVNGSAHGLANSLSSEPDLSRSSSAPAIPGHA